MLEKRNKIEVLSKQPFFSSWPRNAVESLADEMQPVCFQAKEVIVREGEIVDCIYLVLVGKLEVSHKNDAGIDSVIASIEPGETIGLSKAGIFAPNGIRTATVVALTQVEALKLSINEFDEILKKYPNLDYDIQQSFDELLKMNLIKLAAPFIQLSSDLIHEIAKNIVKISLIKNQTLFHEGDDGAFCYIIRSGNMAIERKIDREIKKIATLTSPQIFGETSLLLATKRNASARAETDCELYALPRSVFYDIITKENKSIVSITKLILERASPTCNPNIITSEHTSTTFEKILTLKNPTNHQYMQLRSYGIRIWELIKLNYPMHKILYLIHEEFGFISIDDILDLILLLAHDEFIRIK